jgi:hypothetical protein
MPPENRDGTIEDRLKELANEECPHEKIVSTVSDWIAETDAENISPEVAEHLRKGLYLIIKGKYQEGLQEYRKAEKIDPECARVQNRIGLELSRDEDPNFETHYQKAGELNPIYKTAYKIMALNLLQD